MKSFIDLTSLTLSALSINPNDSFIEETTPFQRKKTQKYIMFLYKTVFFWLLTKQLLQLKDNHLPIPCLTTKLLRGGWVPETSRSLHCWNPAPRCRLLPWLANPENPDE